jgi:sugar/nucleoside kinase (ribokinase family)
MDRLQIVGVGLSTIDILMRLPQMPTWESGGRVKELRLDGGGPVATGLVAAARLGARAGFVGACGSDPAARLWQELLAQYGVDTSRVTCRPGPEQQVILVYVHEKTGERVFAAAEGKAEPLSPQELDREYIVQAGYLMLDGFHRQAGLQAARWMHDAGKKVMLDGSKVQGPVSAQWREQWCELASTADFLICGSGFAPALTGETDLWEAGEALLALGPEVVVMTEGEQGSYTVAGQERFHTPAYNVPVVDTTGAGDVFHGAYLVGQMKGWDLRQTACFASAVSAIKCTRLGGRSGIPSYKETAAFLRKRGEEWL